MGKRETRKVISIPVPEVHCCRLDALARESCRSRAGYVRLLIRAYLQYIEQHPERKLE